MFKRVLAICTIALTVGLGFFLSSRQTIKNHTQKTPKIEHSIKHLALIMDGNRRWAKKQGLKPWVGHKNGTEPVKMSVEFCIEQNIPHLSLYAFSLENFQRPQEELNALFDIIEKGITNDEFQKLFDHGVCVKFIGDRSKFPSQLLSVITDIEQRTANGNKLILNILFCYGGKQELTDAFRNIGEKIKQGKLSPESITPEIIQNYLWTKASPNPDLVIRTGGKKRLSNFLPWQSTYSELVFIDTYWPDITKNILFDIVKNFQKIQRNFGV